MISTRRNAPEAIALYAQSLAEDGHALPPPRTLNELKRDPQVARDIADYMVALVPVPPPTRRSETPRKFSRHRRA